MCILPTRYRMTLRFLSCVCMSDLLCLLCSWCRSAAQTGLPAGCPLCHSLLVQDTLADAPQGWQRSRAVAAPSPMQLTQPGQWCRGSNRWKPLPGAVSVAPGAEELLALLGAVAEPRPQRLPLSPSLRAGAVAKSRCHCSAGISSKETRTASSTLIPWHFHLNER